jgi:hypothetical protein
MKITKLSEQLFNNPEKTAALVIYKTNLYFTSDAVKVIGLWYGDWQYYMHEVFIDEDDPKRLFVKKIDRPSGSKHINKIFPSFFIRYIYGKLNIDKDKKLIFTLTPKPIVINGDLLYEFYLTSIVVYPVTTKVNIQISV